MIDYKVFFVSFLVMCFALNRWVFFKRRLVRQRPIAAKQLKRKKTTDEGYNRPLHGAYRQRQSYTLVFSLHCVLK